MDEDRMESLGCGCRCHVQVGVFHVRACCDAPPKGDERTVTIFHCPPGCRCECARGGACAHVFDRWITERLPGGATQGTALCSRCYMTALAHDVGTLP